MNGRMVFWVVLLLVFSTSHAGYAYLEHSGSISEDETWRAADSPHIVLGLTTVRDSATLTIEPGVEVRFNPAAVNPRLIIGEGGTGGTSGRLIAGGTASQPIVFTSDAADPQPGDWANIYFWPSAADDSSIAHAVIEYGGKSANQGSIHINGSSPAVRNCTVRFSVGSGIHVSGSASEILNCDINWNGLYGLHADDFSGILDGNRFSQNGSYPIYLYLRDYTLPNQPVVNVPNTFVGNNPDQIYFQSCSIRNDFRMVNFGIPYFISGLTTVQNNANLTIEPGVELRFNPAATNPRLIIGEGGTGGTSGRLIAQGTASQPIVFTSDAADPQPGDWANIYFWPSAADDSIIAHAVVEYGGKSPNQGSIHISGSSPAVRNSLVRFNSGSGIHLYDSNSEISCTEIQHNITGIHTALSNPAITNNNFSGNVNYGLYNNSAASVVDARHNWWGDPTGPAGAGPGSGDAVSSYVDYDPWLVEKSACIFEPVIAVAPTALDFGTVGIGDVSKIQVVSISNQGPGGLMIDGLDIAAEADFFLADRSCLRRFLAAGDSCDVWLAFAPSNIGDRAASLVISSNDPAASEVVVDLTGQGRLVTDFDDDLDVDGKDLATLAANPDLISLSVLAASFGRVY